MLKYIWNWENIAILGQIILDVRDTFRHRHVLQILRPASRRKAFVVRNVKIFPETVRCPIISQSKLFVNQLYICISQSVQVQTRDKDITGKLDEQ